MATAPPPRLKTPGESTINPNFASPQIQTAPDVRQSQKVAGNGPAPPGLPQGLPGAPPPTSTPPPKPPTPGLPQPAGGGGTLPTPIPGAPQPATQPPVQPGAGPTVPTSTGAPPGVPNTTPAPPPVVGPPPTPRSIEGKTANEDRWIQAQNEHDQAVYDAALAYNGGPTGALAKNQLRAQDSLRGAVNARGAAGTTESSLMGLDKSRIGTALATANTEANNIYQTALREANDAMEKARILYIEGDAQEKREMDEAAKRAQPTEPSPVMGINPGGEKYVENGGRPEAGGVVPYTEFTPGGYVHVGPPRRK